MLIKQKHIKSPSLNKCDEYYVSEILSNGETLYIDNTSDIIHEILSYQQNNINNVENNNNLSEETLQFKLTEIFYIFPTYIVDSVYESVNKNFELAFNKLQVLVDDESMEQFK